MTESVGMQLDDDSLLALFSRVCKPVPLTVLCTQQHAGRSAPVALRTREQ